MASKIEVDIIPSLSVALNTFSTAAGQDLMHRTFLFINEGEGSSKLHAQQGIVGSPHGIWYIAFYIS